MKTVSELKSLLSRLDGRGYKAYRELEGIYRLAPELSFYLDRAQGDPFAAPSRVRVRLAMAEARFPAALLSNQVRKMALQDYILRAFARELKALSRPRGTGGSGLYRVDAGGQEIIFRSGCLVEEEFVEVRFFMGLPAAGRRILGQTALSMILEEIPRAARALRYSFHPARELEAFVDLVEDVEYIRGQLDDLGLVAF
ncbi:MAG TPA: ATPase, partial [Thermodesulfatator sp.]|nr:ATPase [Thermodesulfatator sp.]